MTERKAGAVIHTHSKSAVLVTLLCDKEFRMSHQEMIKVYCKFHYFEFIECRAQFDKIIYTEIIQGVWNAQLGRYYNFDEEIVVPIIENTCFESELEGSLHDAMLKYPSTSAVLVRRHGIYVWGTSWQQTKAM